MLCYVMELRARLSILAFTYPKFCAVPLTRAHKAVGLEGVHTGAYD